MPQASALLIGKLAHALRSPLNAIHGWTSLLEERPPSAGASPLFARAIAGIHTGVQQQVRLIDALCDASDMFAGRLSIFRRPMRLATAIETALERIQDLAFDKNVMVGVRIGCDEAMIDGDHGRIVQVFQELLSNALRNTPPHGRVVVTARRAPGRVIATIQDSGCGLAPGHEAWLWNPLRAVESGSAIGDGRLGLGLAFTKALVLLHDGSIEARSEGRDRGTTIEVAFGTLAPKSSAT